MKTQIMKLAAMAFFSLLALARPGQAGFLDDYYLQQFGVAARVAERFESTDNGLR